LSTVRGEVQALDRNLPLTNVWPIGEVLSQSLWPARFGAALLAIFAALAVVLCAVGIYGVVGYTVGQRVREIGIRLALGARPRDVLFMVVRQTAVTLSIGLVIGLVAAFLLARNISDLLFDVSATTPLPFVTTALILTLVGLLASYIPARRAAKVDPMVALHHE
jgi:putative ABC transport system permease protein